MLSDVRVMQQEGGKSRSVFFGLPCLPFFAGFIIALGSSRQNSKPATCHHELTLNPSHLLLVFFFISIAYPFPLHVTSIPLLFALEIILFLNGICLFFLSDFPEPCFTPTDWLL